MKKVLLVFLLGLTLLAGAKQWTGPYNPYVYFETFSEYYADGELLLEGECFALVWQRDGVEFKGFNATGTIGLEGTLPVDPANCVVLKVWPEAIQDEYEDEETHEMVGYSCAVGLYVRVAQSFLNSHQDGKLSIYFFDTRVKTDSGFVLAANTLNAGGEVTAISVLNGYGVVTGLEAIEPIDGSDGWMRWNEQAIPAYGDFDEPYMSVVSEPSQVPADCPRPVIADFAVSNALAWVTVTNAASYLRFTLLSGDSPTALGAAPVAVEPEQGRDAGAIVLRAPVGADAKKGFFKVIRNPF